MSILQPTCKALKPTSNIIKVCVVDIHNYTNSAILIHNLLLSMFVTETGENGKHTHYPIFSISTHYTSQLRFKW